MSLNAPNEVKQKRAENFQFSALKNEITLKVVILLT